MTFVDEVAWQSEAEKALRQDGHGRLKSFVPIVAKLNRCTDDKYHVGHRLNNDKSGSNHVLPRAFVSKFPRENQYHDNQCNAYA